MEMVMLCSVQCMCPLALVFMKVQYFTLAIIALISMIYFEKMLSLWHSSSCLLVDVIVDIFGPCDYLQAYL